MATPVIMPRQGQSVESCILTEWKVSVGDQVAEGDVLAVIETDKASFDLESTASGSVLALFWEADDDVPVLANVAAIGQRDVIQHNVGQGHPFQFDRANQKQPNHGVGDIRRCGHHQRNDRR